MPKPRRRRYHERLATVLLASPIAEKDPLTIVRHLEAAGHVNHAGELAMQAARRAEGTLAFELAAALWDVALRLSSPDQDARRELLMRRAQALSHAGRGPESAQAWLAAASGADAETGFQCRRHAAHELLVSGHIHEGLALMKSVLAELGEVMPPTTAARKRLLVWRWIKIALRGTKFTANDSPDVRRAIDILRFETLRSASLGLSMVDVLPGAAFQAKAVLIALSLGDRRRIAYALCFHAMYLASSGIRVKEARRLVAQARGIAKELDHPLLLAWTRAGEGITEFFAGHHVSAFEILKEAELSLSERSVGMSAELNHIRNFILFDLRRLGAYDELRDRMCEYTRDALRRGDRYAATSFVWSSNNVWLAADDVSRAHADLASVTWSPPEEGVHLQHWFLVRAQTDLAMYEDDSAALDALIPSLHTFLGPAFTHVQAVTTETRYQLARIAIRRGDAAAARAVLKPLLKYEVPYIRAFVRLGLAAADALDGKTDSAHELLAGSIADSERGHMVAMAALARRRQAELSKDARAIAEADTAIRARGIANPAAFSRMLATWPRAKD